MFLYIAILVSAIGGFSVCFYIWRTKRAHKVLICPVGADCNAVVHSEYSTLFGIPLENYGMLYYAGIGLTYLIFFVVPHLIQPVLMIAAFTGTAVSFLFTMYFLYVQIIVIRQGCSWCLSSAVFSTIIFLAAFLIII